jgi:Rieske Fe-S protein
MPVTRRKFQHVSVLVFPIVYGVGVLAAAVRFLKPLPRRPRDKRLDLEQNASYFEEPNASPIDVEFNGRKVFVLHDGERIRAFDSTCTHLDCSVAWKNRRGRFVCPCHGAEFGADGSVKKKPATSPLKEFALAPIGADGKITLLDRVIEPSENVS